ncbi:M1 family aminopeptidase [Candidatus Neomarinimicrobiota bacterium]
MLKPICHFLLLATLTSLIWGQSSLDIAYNMQLEFLPGDSAASPTIAGTNLITIINHWKSPIADVYLHNNSNGYYKPADPLTAKTVLGDITGDNVLAVEEAAALSVRIGLDPPIDVGDTLTLTVPFTTRLSGHPHPFLPTYGSRGDTTIYNLIFFYPILEYFYDDGWHTDMHSGKADPHTNPAAYDVSIIYPQSMTIATSAHTVPTDTLVDGNMVIKTHYPRANYFSFVLANNFVQYHNNVRGINVDIACTPGQSHNADKIFGELETILPIYERQFGPCPNDKMTITMSYALGKNTGALATTNYIIYNGGMSSINTLAHEFAHQWFGEAVNADETFEPWLNESFAEYAARKYMQQRPATIKKQAEKPTTDGFFDLWTDFRSLTPEKLYWAMPDLIGDQALPPIYREGHALNWDNLDDMTSLVADAIIIYFHGSNALLMLEAAVGDSMMRQIMLEYTSQYRWRTAQTRDFVRVISDLAGPEIGDNFLAAITNSHRPDPRITDVKAQQTDSGWSTTVTTASDGPWSLPWDVQLITGVGDTITQSGLLLQDSPHTFNTNAKIASIKFAPSGRVIDRNLSNNRWPRKALLQPIIGLPSWEYYKLYLRPSIKSDWQGNMRYGLTLRGILGANFMPFLPTWFSRSFKLGVNYAPDKTDRQFGYNFSYTMPIWGNPYYQLKLAIMEEYPKRSQVLGLTTYLGQPKYYFNGGIAQYNQLKINVGRVEYDLDEDRWPGPEYYYGETVLRSYRHGLHSRTHITTSLLYGSDSNKNKFFRLGFDAEHSRPLLHMAALNLWLELRLGVPDEPSDQYVRFGKSQSPFSDEQGISKFRGRTEMEDKRWNNSFAWGLTIGNSTPKRFLPKLVAYLDMALTSQAPERLLDDQSELCRAAGIGLEGNSIISYGLYMPLWVSHPPSGEAPLKLRLMGQFRLNW